MHNAVPSRLKIPETFPRRGLALLGAICLGLGGVAVYLQSRSPSLTPSTPADTAVIPTLKTVTALGRLEPTGDIIKLTASTSTQENRIQQLLVKEGDRVQTGQTIAILDNRDRLQAALAKAQEDVRVAQTSLDQVKAGAKSGDIAAQSAKVNQLEAQWQGEEAAQIATINRLEAQQKTERAAQIATIDRIKAQWQGDRASQTAAISRLEAEATNAEAEYERYRQLSNSGAVSQSLFDTKRLSLDTSREQVAEAQANLERINHTAQEQIAEAQANLEKINSTLTQHLQEAEANLERIRRTGAQQVREAASQLDSIAEVRPVDVQLAQAEVDRARAAAQQAQADLDQASVRSPQDGVVLAIHTRAGEAIDSAGIVELGQTQQMYAVAEVYQSDIHQVQLGQTAEVTSEALPQTLRGTVERIDNQVQRQTVVNTDPSQNIDARVVEVHIPLDPASSQQAAQFTNLQVEVKIEL
ncbi:MAG: biotin/lipoyl-binding protein [Oscillatoriales cyanobacterium RM1_1_9]|nr:biotin/lipoyl-binding protein [Oscillatoriales cyanobacterium SM2_3_0]NJO46091.1 biotin/lipoyl-binding protein [Oscillatoriales cyanobacterium RM2_1_1]NJO71125.1 biotin/lipoyl-binding protein [Oscillatoriales cyanobacterium RM1_1_9]